MNLQGGNNLFQYSQDFTNAVWTKINSTSVTSTSVVAPDGTATASTISITANGGFRTSAAFTAGLTYSDSIWVKQSASGGASAIRLTTNNALAYNTGLSQKFTLTSSWQRVSLSGILNSSGTNGGYQIFGALDVTGANDATCVGNVDVWGAQFELGTVASAYTPTTTTAITTTNNISVPSGSLFVSPASTVIAQTNTINATNTVATIVDQAALLIDNLATTGGNSKIIFRINSTVVGGVRVDSVGNFNWQATGSQGHQFYNSTNAGLTSSINPLGITVNANAGNVAPSGVALDILGSIGFRSGTNNGATPYDTFLARDAANTLAQRNTTNAQTFRLYNTYTSSTSYETLQFDWTTTANTATISTQKGSGGGTLRTLAIGQPLVISPGYTVATLPTGVVGMRAYVTNALAPSYGVAVTGGGAVTIPVFYNGTAWICA